MEHDKESGITLLVSSRDTRFAALALGDVAETDEELKRAAGIYKMDKEELGQDETEQLKKGLLSILQGNREADATRLGPPDISRPIAIFWLSKLGVEIPSYPEQQV